MGSTSQLWLGSRSPEVADAIREDRERGQRIVRRLYLGEATDAPDGWHHLRTVVRVQTETFDSSGELTHSDDRYLVSEPALFPSNP